MPLKIQGSHKCKTRKNLRAPVTRIACLPRFHKAVGAIHESPVRDGIWIFKGAHMSRPPFIAIGLLSACVLAYEVLLTRLFSIVLWHHFAYMIISAAMLGYGASGTVLTLLKEKIAPHFGAVYVTAAAALAVLMPAAFLLAQQVPFNPLELLWDNSQPAKLLAVYLLMMLPFFCGGLGIGLVFSHFG